MKLSDILNVNNIVVPIQAHERDLSIQELLNKLVDNGTLTASSKLLEYIENIENHQSTAVGKGVAYPHSISIEVENLEAILGVSVKGIDYSAPDGQLCHFILLTLAPLDNPKKHRKFITLFRTMIDNAKIRTMILDANNNTNVYNIIQDWELEQIYSDDLE